jgi:hypothetical protein
MSEDFSAVEKWFKEVMINLMTERVMLMSAGIQTSSTRTVQASPSTTRRAGPVRPSMEKRTKHKEDLANEKLIPTILLD